MIIIWFCFLTLFLYAFLILKYTFGWHALRSVSNQNFSPKVSVIIAIRNEEDKIVPLINHLSLQIYDKDKLEFILVDDHSNDNTLNLLKQYATENMKVINMPDGNFGKKDAISIAVSNSNGEVIIATDADCTFSPNWVSTMAGCFADPKVKLVSGPVMFSKKNKGIFHSLQALEFSSLIATGAGSIATKNAIFCNGANMAYRKSVFLDLNNFKNDSLASGDDVFLLHNIKKEYPTSLSFIKEHNAIVTTNTAKNFSSFINQRKRWTAKSVKYKDLTSIYVAYLVLFTNLSLFILSLFLFLDISFYRLFMIFFIIKFIVDLLLLYPTLIFFNRKDLIKWIFPFEFLYSIYVILIVPVSFITEFDWKGRQYKK